MTKPAQKRKLPYLTEDDLNKPAQAVTIGVFGKYTKRAEQRKEVYEDDYETTVDVPLNYQMGHVKLQVNRYIKNELKGIRARTWQVDPAVQPKPSEKKYRVRDFMSHQGIMDNESAKRMYEEKVARRRAEREAMEDPDYVPPAFQDDTQYGNDGLPPLSDKVYAAR